MARLRKASMIAMIVIILLSSSCDASMRSSLANVMGGMQDNVLGNNTEMADEAANALSVGPDDLLDVPDNHKVWFGNLELMLPARMKHTISTGDTEKFTEAIASAVMNHSSEERFIVLLSQPIENEEVTETVVYTAEAFQTVLGNLAPAVEERYRPILESLVDALESLALSKAPTLGDATALRLFQAVIAGSGMTNTSFNPTMDDIAALLSLIDALERIRESTEFKIELSEILSVFI